MFGTYEEWWGAKKAGLADPRFVDMGIVFAQLQLRAIWSHLLRNFDFELLEPRYEPSYDRMLVGPRSPARVRYRRR